MYFLGDPVYNIEDGARCSATEEVLKKRLEEIRLDMSIQFGTGDLLKKWEEMFGKLFGKMTPDELELYKMAFLIGQEWEVKKCLDYAEHGENAQYRRPL